MRSALIWVGAVLFLAVSGISGALLLPSCAVRLPFGIGTLGFCEVKEEQGSLAALHQSEHSTLSQQVADLEGQLRGIQCPIVPQISPIPQAQAQPAPIQPKIAEPPAVEPEAVQPKLADPQPVLPAHQNTAPPDQPQELNDDMFRKGDISALQGCWKLDSDYTVVDRSNGHVTHYDEWNECFIQDGTGFENMKGTDGSTCAGPVAATFTDPETLTITENDLPCTAFSVPLPKRVVTCKMGDDGRAHCVARQLGLGTAEDVIMRRAEGNE